MLAVVLPFALLAFVQTWRARYWKRQSMRPRARRHPAGPTSLEPGPQLDEQRHTPHERPQGRSRRDDFDDPDSQ